MKPLPIPTLVALALPLAAMSARAQDDRPEAVTEALARAAKDNTRALVVAGDGGVRALLEKDLARLVLYEYEVARLPEDDAWAAKLRPTGTEGPFVAVLAADGEVLASAAASAVASKAELEALLKRWQAEPLNAMQVLADGLKEAAETKRQVLVHFSAPW